MIDSPALGMSRVPDALLGSGTALRDGVAVVGDPQRADKVPVLWRPARGGTWNVEPIGSSFGWARDVAGLGGTQVVVGVDLRDEGSTAPVGSWAAVRQPEGNWAFTDLGSLLGGKSTEVIDVSLTGSADDANTMFIIAGLTADSPPSERYTQWDLDGVRPFVAVSANGFDWNPGVDSLCPKG